MGLKCRIAYRDGKAFVFDRDGSPSQLFAEALNLTGNQAEALNIWATASTPEFLEAAGRSGESVSVNEVLKFYSADNSVQLRLLPEQRFQVAEVMSSVNIETLSELSEKLNSIFRPQGVMQVNTEAALQSGLYSTDDLRTLNLDEVSDLMDRIEGELLVEDFEVEPLGAAVTYQNPQIKTVLGTSKVVTQDDIDSEIVAMLDDLSSESEFYEKMQMLPYSELVDRFYESRPFATRFMKRFAGLKKLPLVEVRGTSLVKANTRTYATLRNTIPAGANTVSLEADIDYLSSIPADVWETAQEEVQKVVKEVEKSLINLNVDVIGLADYSQNKDRTLTVLRAAHNMLNLPTEENMAAFTALYDELLGTPVVEVMKLPEKYQKLNVTKVYSQLSDQELFTSFGLLKIGENTYQKVDQSAAKADMYEYLYNKVVEGELNIPQELRLENDLKNKTGVLEDLEKFVSTRDTGLGYYSEVASLYQLVFDHDLLPVRNIGVDLAHIASIKTDPEYLKTDFVSDFYKYLLEEKEKNSDLYRSVLSNFSITNQDITLTGKVVDISGIRFSEELYDYARLSKNSTMKSLLPPVYSENLEALSALNFPESIRDIDETYYTIGAEVLTPLQEGEYAKIAGTLYKKVMEDQNASLFSPVRNIQDNTYFQTEAILSYSFSEAQDALNRFGNLLSPTMSKSDADFILQKGGLASDMLVQLNTSRSNEDYNSLVSEQAGVRSVLDSRIEILPLYAEQEENEIYRKLDSCG